MTAITTQRTFKLVAKIAIAVFLLYALFRLGSIDYSLLLTIFQRPFALVAAVFCLFLGLLLGGVRWWILLDISGHRLPVRQALKLQMIGGFFSTYLPGAAGGDLIRAAYMLKIVQRNEGRTAAMLSIVIDRIFALLGLIFVGAAASAYIIRHESYADTLGSYTGMMLILVIASPALLVGLLLITLALPKVGAFHMLPHRIQTYIRILHTQAFLYFDRWPSALGCMALSIVASTIVIIGILIIAAAFPIAPEPIVTAIAAVFGNVFSAVPLTPGGVGVGETAFQAVCQELAGTSAPYASIYLTFRILMLVANIPGGMLAIRDRIRRRVPTEV